MPQEKKWSPRQILTGLFILALPFLLLLSSKESQVYICLGPTAYSYHKTKDCTGLRRCSKEIILVERSTAIKKYNRDSCGYCYRPRK